MKKWVSVLLAFVIVASMATMAWADEEYPEPDTPLDEYANAYSATVSLSKQGSKSASISLLCSGKTGTTSITATVYLQKQSGSSWVNSTINGNASYYTSGTNYLNASVTTSVTAGTYRAKAVYKVTCNGSTETITVYSSSVTFS